MAGTAGVPAAQPCEYLAISGRDSIGAKHDLTPSIYAHQAVAFRQCPKGRRAHASPAQLARAAGAAIVIATRCFEPNTPPNARKSSDRALQRHVAALVFINGYHADSKHSVLPRHNGAGIKRYLQLCAREQTSCALSSTMACCHGGVTRVPAHKRLQWTQCASLATRCSREWSLQIWRPAFSGKPAHSCSGSSY